MFLQYMPSMEDFRQIPSELNVFHSVNDTDVSGMSLLFHSVVFAQVSSLNYGVNSNERPYLCGVEHCVTRYFVYFPSHSE